MNKEWLKVLKEIKEMCKKHLREKGRCMGCVFADTEEEVYCDIAGSPDDWRLPNQCKHCGEVI